MTTSRSAFLIALAPALGGLLFGYDTAVISGTIELVRNQFALTTAYEGWFVSSGLVGCIIGVLIAGALSNSIGRKKVLVLSGLAFLVSAIGCAFAPSKEWLVMARLVGGIGVGVASVVAPMYISEFAPASKRGMLVALYQLAITIGIFMAYLVNAGIASAAGEGTPAQGWFSGQESWRGMFLMMALPSILFITILAYIPESIRYLLHKGKTTSARNILFGTRDRVAAEQEWDRLATYQNLNTTALRGDIWKSIRFPLLIGIVLAFFQQFSGINAVIYYGPEIFKKAGIASENALLFQSIIGGVNVLFTFVAIRNADKAGRRPLLLYGLVGLIVSLSLIGWIFHSSGVPGYILLLCMLVFIACFALSLGPVTWILINEIFPASFRVQGVTICTLAVWLAVALLGQFFPTMLATFGAANTFLLFAFFCLLHLLFSYKFIPETKGKQLEEIEQIFMNH
ncbi:MAG TPA: sugar porter family MFS transporter [Chitinophagaceae bacterium]